MLEMKESRGISLAKRTTKVDEFPWKKEPGFIQGMLFDVETDDSDVSHVAEADDHKQFQNNHNLNAGPKEAVDSEEDNTKSYFTPKEIIRLMVGLLDPLPETRIYDPCCGSGASLIAIQQYLEQKYPGREATLFGQEPHSDLCAQARTALSQNGDININICVGNTLQEPKWLDYNGELKRFDYIISNPPWNGSASEDFARVSHAERFKYEKPTRYADWGWMQHILASLDDQGRAVILTSMGAITRGVYSERSSEQRIRTQFILNDEIEMVVRLPDSLFADVSFPCALLILNRHKPVERQKQILEIDASELFVTTVGEQAKKKLSQEAIDIIPDLYKRWETQVGLSKVVTMQEAEAKRYNLNPSVYNRVLPHKSSIEEMQASLEKISYKVKSIREEHCHIYTEMAARLDNQRIVDVALSGAFSASIRKIVATQPQSKELPSIVLLRQHISHLQSLIQQEIALEEEYKQNLMHSLLTEADWCSERLGTITTVSNGGNPPTKDKTLYGNEFYWVQIRDLNNGKIKSTTKMLSEKGVSAITSETRLQNVKLVKGKDNVVTEDLLHEIDTVLVAKLNGCTPQGKVGILGVPAVTNGEICCIEPRPDIFLPDYLLYYVIYIRHIWADYASQTRKEPRVENAVISDTQIVLPPKDDQQKIVESLRAVDEKIHALQDEKDLLRSLKR